MIRVTAIKLALASITLLAASDVSASLAATWLDQSWPRRVELTATPTMIAGTLPSTDITLLVHMNATNLADVFALAKPDGSDLILTAGDGATVLPHELVSFDALLEDAELWFKANTLSQTSNTFYLYYGNPDTTVASTKDQAWTTDHLAVYHFDEDPGAVTEASDSGPGDGMNPATIGAGSTLANSDLVAGQIGGGWHFDGTDDWLQAQSITSPDSSFTISAWFADTNLSLEGMTALQSLSGFWDVSFRRNSANLRADLTTSSGGTIWQPTITDSLMHHYTWTLDAVSDTARFFLDGVESNIYASQVFGGGAHAFTGTTIQGSVGIAGPVFFNSFDLTNGVVDEFRIAEGVRNPDRILTEFNNQNDPGAFFNYRIEAGGVSTAVDPTGIATLGGRIRIWPNPFQGRTSMSIELDSPSVTVRVYDLAGRLVRTLPSVSAVAGVRSLSWDGRDDSGSPVGSGIYYVKALGQSKSLSAKVLLRR